MKAGGEPTRSKSDAATTAKRRPAPKAARVSSPAKTKVENPAKTEVERLALELQEARERQAATAEILSLISDSPTGIQPVFDRIVKNAARLCQSVLSAVYRREGDHVDLVAYDQFSPTVGPSRNAWPVREAHWSARGSSTERAVPTTCVWPWYNLSTDSTSSSSA